MVEHEPRRVQRLAAETLQRRAELVARTRRQSRSAAVDRVTDERRANVRHVHADLVRATGLELDLAVRVRAEALEHPVARARLAPVVDDRHPRALARMPSDRRVDVAAPGQHALAYTLIRAPDAAALELGG